MLATKVTYCKICCSDSGAVSYLGCNTVWTGKFCSPDMNVEFCHRLVALCLRVGKAEEDTVGRQACPSIR
jgi:hypothetical protein